MKTKIFLLLFCLSFSSTVLSQVLIGVNYEPFHFSADIKSGATPFGLSLSLGYRIDSTKAICFRPGFSASEDIRFFSGFDYLILGQYFFISDKYVLAGLNFYNNTGNGTNSIGIKQQLITFFMAGLGFKPSNLFHLEGSVHIPIRNKKFAYRNTGFGSIEEYKIDYLIKFSLGIEFNL
jgi:hypothetical protein